MKKKYAEGVVVEGGAFGFRMKADNGDVLRFNVRDGVVSDPEDFHAYYGDKVAVTYYTATRRGHPWNEALELKMLVTSPDRIDFSSGYVDGIIRFVDSMRYLIHLPAKDLTVSFRAQHGVSIDPAISVAKPGNYVRVFFSIEAKRFINRLIFTEMQLLEKGPIEIRDTIERGVFTEFLTKRKIRLIPLKFAFKGDGKEPLAIFTGVMTKASPEDMLLKVGTTCTVRHYSLLVGDQSRRRVAAGITW